MMSARLDGRLAGAADKALDNHLSGCSRCRGEWDALWSVDQFLSAAEMAPAPVDLHLRVTARLERRQRVRRAVFGGVTLSLGTVVLAALALSPLLLGLANLAAVVPIWESGGREAARVMVSLLGTCARVGVTLLRAFALPLAGIAACALFFAALMNGLWIGALYRLRPTR
jgi:predicted anti-sigma-YlaC factor YlaD